MVDPSSPTTHFSLAGNFTPEDIQELLVAMSGENHAGSPRSEPQTPLTSSMGPTGKPGSSDGTLGEGSGNVDYCATAEGGGFGETEEEEDGKPEAEDGEKAQARSERKRSREKKRRSDVNKQFADLTQLLKQIESEESGGDELVASRLSFPSATNRVDLIARTIGHLERLHRSNKRRKVETESLQKQLDEAKKAGEDAAAKLKEASCSPAEANKQYMMMVPMMMSQDSMAGRGAPMPMMNPFMAPHAFFPTQFPSAPPPAPQAVETPTANSTAEQKQPSPPQQELAAPSQPTAPSMMQPAVQTAMSMPPMGFPPLAAMQQQQQPYATMPFMMPNPMGGMPPMMTPMMPPVAGQQSTATGQSQMSQQVNATSSGDSGVNGNKGQDKTSSDMGGGNLAHCA